MMEGSVREAIRGTGGDVAGGRVENVCSGSA